MADIGRRGSSKAERAGAARPRRGYVVGVTIFIKEGGELGLFENGLRQNVLFLYHLFRAAPDCARVLLLNHGDGEAGEIPRRLAWRARTSSARRRCWTRSTM